MRNFKFTTAESVPALSMEVARVILNILKFHLRCNESRRSRDYVGKDWNRAENVAMEKHLDTTAFIIVIDVFIDWIWSFYSFYQRKLSVLCFQLPTNFYGVLWT